MIPVHEDGAGHEADSSKAVLRRLAGTDSIAELTDLLHRAYRRLADMGLCYWATHQTEEQTRERIAGGHYRHVGAGDVLVNNSGGGGGWGDPFVRDPALVLEDVLDGYVTVEGAARDYGVAVDLERQAIDEEKTARLRAGPHPSEPMPIGHDTPGPRPLVAVEG